MNEAEYLKALKKLPKEFNNNKTVVQEFGGNIYVANPDLAPIVYKKGSWKEVAPYGVSDSKR